MLTQHIEYQFMWYAASGERKIRCIDQCSE
jgi:hypothetical protein